jgi:hypothetical protein
MVMHSALFVANIGNNQDAWTDFLMKVAPRQQKSQGVLRLAENVWIVNFQTSPEYLAKLVYAADGLGVPYGILPFQHEPEWLPAGFDPKTIQAQSEGDLP